MAPAATKAAANTASNIKSENSKSVKALEELFSRLNVSKAADEVLAVSHDIATFINGDIEEADAPTQYVQYNHFLTRIQLT
jgi:elongation factor 3